MKTRFLIIIAIILAGSLTVIFSQQTEMECLRLYKDIQELSRTPGMILAEQQTMELHKNLVFEYVEKSCPDFSDLEFMYNNYKQSIPEPEPNPIPEEYDVKPTTKQDQYLSPFDEEWIHEFQENYHTVITGKVIDVFGQKPPTKYDYQYRVTALAHHTPRMQEDSIYKIFGNDDEFVVPINADVVLFGLDIDDEGLLYIVKTVIQEKPQP
ncbi:MAG: hypothetical protein ACE5RC_02755 [Nitrosopumilus sp.]